MSYGLKTWSANGTPELDTGKFTYQVIHNQVYQLTGANTITVPITGFSPSNCAAVILPTTAPTGTFSSQAMPYESVVEGVVTIRSKNPSEPGTVGSAIQFRLLVMRYG
ncbi:PKD domain-containing protein [Pseudomonas sp. IT-P291]